MTYLLKCALTAGFLLQGLAAMAAEPLVDVAWVRANLQTEGVAFVDLRPKSAYAAGHIPGAVRSQYGGPNDQWRERVGDVPGLMRAPDQIAAHLGSIGIANDTHVVLVPGGFSSGEISAATRVYWTLTYLGHEKISILNGGMVAYLSERDANRAPVNPLEGGVSARPAATFVAAPRPEMLVSPEDVEAMAGEGVMLVDNRTNDYFLGVSKSGSAKVAGTLEGSVNLPHTWTTDNARGSFRGTEALSRLYAAAGVPTEGPQISFCNTGQLASVGWFVSHELLGNKEALMYDGSLAEWTHSGRTTERKVEF